MIVDVVTVGPFQENCYLVLDEGEATAVLVDPGDDGDQVVAMADRRGVTPTAVWLTHAHLDHIGAVSAVRRKWPGIPVYLHPLDRPVYAWGARSAAEFGVPFEQPEPADAPLAEGDELRLGRAVFTVWHVPGHAPGHVAFVGPGIVLSGDCLFAGSIGRTDLPLCDPAALVMSLERLAGLPQETVVFPGHGPSTTIGGELRANPFLNGLARVSGTTRMVAVHAPARGGN